MERLARDGGLSYLFIPAVDVRELAAFYQELVGWTIGEDDDDAVSFEDGTGHVAGKFFRDHAVSKHPGLLPYIYVSNVDDVAGRLAALGGELVDGPRFEPPDDEKGLRVATFRDPAGNLMGLWNADRQMRENSDSMS